MDLAGKTAIVTGGARGIGAALADALAAVDVRVCTFDLAEPEQHFDLHLTCDVSDAAALSDAISVTENSLGPIDIYVSNAGVLSDQPDHAASASDADWASCWSVNVMAHVHAARVLLPRMVARGSGHFVIVASAAGLLSQIGDAAYSATKHAAVSFADSLAITHGDDGVGVTLACPQYVATPLIGLADEAAEDHPLLLTAGEVAGVVLESVRDGRFLALPHPEVAGYVQARAQDHDRWIKGMSRLRRRAIETAGRATPDVLYHLV
jgi:NAD(P)-dependent dehydrogenase (short-subunit alcohol dehydrogenase family)